MSDKILSREGYQEKLRAFSSPSIAVVFEAAEALAGHDKALRAALQEAQQEVLLLTAAYDSFAGLLGFARNASRDDIEQRLLELRADRDKWRERHEQVTADLAKERETSERRHKWNESLTATLNTANRELDAERETSRELDNVLGVIEHIAADDFCDDLDMRSDELTGDAKTLHEKVSAIYRHSHSSRRSAVYYARHDDWRKETAEAARLIAKGGESEANNEVVL